VFDAATSDRFKQMMPYAEGSHMVTGRRFLQEYSDAEIAGLIGSFLDRLPGFVRAPSGLPYALVFIGRSGEPFPSGVEISAVVDALEPIEGDVLDRDLWAILRWMIAGVGGSWTVEDLDRAGKLYRVPAAAG